MAAAAPWFIWANPDAKARLCPAHSVSCWIASPTGNREQHMLDRCKAVAKRAGLDPGQFDLKTFRSTYATRMLRAGFDVRMVQHWMGHKSLETTMRYLVPATEVHAKLDQIDIPGASPARVLSRRRAASEMGHKSLETTMRYLVPATEVHTKLDQIDIPGS
jgi:integrase